MVTGTASTDVTLLLKEHRIIPDVLPEGLVSAPVALLNFIYPNHPVHFGDVLKRADTLEMPSIAMDAAEVCYSLCGGSCSNSF